MAMRYERCLECKQLGITCDGPNLLSMNPGELGEWCDELRKKRPGFTYDKTAAVAKISKTAAYGFLTGAHEDCNYFTAHAVSGALILSGGEWTDCPCGNVSNSEKAAYEAEIEKLKTSVVWHEDKIKDLKEKNVSLETLVKNTNARMTKDKEFLQEQIKSKNRAIIILAICLVLLMLLIITALVIDRLDPSIGFFWLEGLLHPQSVTDGFNLIGKAL